MSSTIQFANYLRDRVHIKIKVQRNMETVNDPVHEGMHLTMVAVTNAGRRPVTITNVDLMHLYNRGAIFTDNIPHIPCELTEGKYVTTLVNQEGLRFDEIRHFVAYDAIGREYKNHFAPLRRRIYWWFRRKLSHEDAKASKERKNRNEN